jgi:hypothetical protein
MTTPFPKGFELLGWDGRLRRDDVNNKNSDDDNNDNMLELGNNNNNNNRLEDDNNRLEQDNSQWYRYRHKEPTTAYVILPRSVGRPLNYR